MLKFDYVRLYFEFVAYRWFAGPPRPSLAVSSPHTAASSSNECLGRIEPVSGKREYKVDIMLRGAIMSEIWVGVDGDVSKERLAVAVRPGVEARSVENNKVAIKALTRKLKKLEPQRVVLEATGGYEYELASSLGKAGLSVVVNPRQVLDFAKATGGLAKTDPIDAKILAHFAEAVKPPCRTVRDPQLDELISWSHVIGRWSR